MNLPNVVIDTNRIDLVTMEERRHFSVLHLFVIEAEMPFG